MAKCKKILEMHLKGKSDRQIAKELHVSRNRVSEIRRAFYELSDDDKSVAALSESELEVLLFPKKAPPVFYAEPDFAYVHNELSRPGVTLQLLWEEYQEQCQLQDTQPYMYSRFCDLYRLYCKKSQITSHLEFKPGDQTQCDWAGKKMYFTDPVSGTRQGACVFVAVLPYSGYCFARSYPNMAEESWIQAHNDMAVFFGGVTRVTVCDNTKTAVLRNRKKEDPLINKAYAEWAQHYGTALLPTRVYRPKDKAMVEDHVGILTNKIIGKLRNCQFFTLDQINDAIACELEAFNGASFQRKPGSRLLVFREQEQQYLLPLPRIPYVRAIWKELTVQKNCHVCTNHRYYSVPYQYVGKKVQVRIDDLTVKVYHNEDLLCEHPRFGSGAYQTDPAHMSPNHQAYSGWSAVRFEKWAQDTVGPAAKNVMHCHFASRQIEEQGYKQAFAIMGLKKQYGSEKLENACQIVLREQRPLCAHAIEGAIRELEQLPTSAAAESYALVRGGAYYAKGGTNDEQHNG